MKKPAILQNAFEGVKEELKESGKTVIEQIGVAQKKRDDQNAAFIKGLYGEAAPVGEEEKQKKELEDKQKAEVLKQRLHSEYYQRLVNPPKAAEERPAEKVKREKEEEDWELQKKEAKKPKLSAQQLRQRGTAELPKVVSG